MTPAELACFNPSRMDAHARIPLQSDAAAGPSGPGGADLFVQLAAGLAEGRDLPGLLQRLLESVIALTGARAGAVRLLSPEGDRLRLLSEVGLPSTVHRCEASVDSRCGTCGAATAAGHAVSSTDLGVCAERAGVVFFGQECRRLLAVPLQHRGRVLGVYNLFLADDREPGPEVVSVLRSAGELLGLVLDNARLEAESVRTTQLQERQMMAAEIHDAIAQTLTFVKMRLPLLEDAVAARDEDRALRYLGDVRGAVGEAHGSLREIITHFRTCIDPGGLSRALHTLAARFRERNAIELRFTCRGLPASLSGEVQAEVFHIVQEALANVERHSLARHAWLEVIGCGCGLDVTVDDDGVGPAAANEVRGDGTHHGIAIMQDRAARLGGDFGLEPRPGGGTRVRLSWQPIAGGRS